MNSFFPTPLVLSDRDGTPIKRKKSFIFFFSDTPGHSSPDVIARAHRVHTRVKKKKNTRHHPHVLILKLIMPHMTYYTSDRCRATPGPGGWEGGFPGGTRGPERRSDNGRPRPPGPLRCVAFDGIYVRSRNTRSEDFQRVYKRDDRHVELG